MSLRYLEEIAAAENIAVYRVPDVLLLLIDPTCRYVQEIRSGS